MCFSILLCNCVTLGVTVEAEFCRAGARVHGGPAHGRALLREFYSVRSHVACTENQKQTINFKAS